MCKLDGHATCWHSRHASALFYSFEVHVAMSTAQACCMPQGKDFAPKVRPKHAQHGSAAGLSLPQVSRKRKAQHSTSSRVPATAGTSGCKSHKVDTKNNNSSSSSNGSRTERLKRLGKQSKQADADAAPPKDDLPVVKVSFGPQQDSAHGSEHAQLPLPVSSLDAHVSGIPHTQLVHHTMQSLSRTLSTQPLLSLGQQELLPEQQRVSSAHAVSPAASAMLDKVPSRHPAALEAISVGASAPILQPFLAGAAQDADISIAIVKAVSAQPGNWPPVEGTCADMVALQIQGSNQLEMGNAQSGDVQRQADGHCQGQTEEGVVEQAEGQIRGQAEGQSEGLAEGQPRGREGLSSDTFEQQQATGVPTGNALQQLISRAQKLKQQLDAHAERKASR